MARRRKVGDVYRFDFDEKYHCYCQILYASDVAFMNFYSSDENDNIDEILKLKDVFRIWLDRDFFKSEKLRYICNKDLSEERKVILNKYNKPIGSDCYYLFKNDRFFPASRDECIGLEYTAAWLESGVIDRLNYSFFGKELPPHIRNDVPFYN